jgi:hypothetical protein
MLPGAYLEDSTYHPKCGAKGVHFLEGGKQGHALKSREMRDTGISLFSRKHPIQRTNLATKASCDCNISLIRSWKTSRQQIPPFLQSPLSIADIQKSESPQRKAWRPINQTDHQNLST